MKPEDDENGITTCKGCSNSNKYIILIVSLLIILPGISLYPSSGASSNNPPWFFAGATLNYNLDVSYGPLNSSNLIFNDSFRIASIYGQSFQFYEKLNNSTIAGIYASLSNESILTNSIIANNQENGALILYGGSGDVFYAVNETILNSLSSHSAQYWHFINATSPLNVSRFEYSYNSEHIEAFKAYAVESNPGPANSTTSIYVKFYIDAYSGVILSMTQNWTYSNGFVNRTWYLESTNVPLENPTHAFENYPLDWVLVVVAIAAIVASIFVWRIRKESSKEER